MTRKHKKDGTEKKSPDLYLLHHTPDVIQKNIRLQLDFVTPIPISLVQLKVFGTAANHQREQNCQLHHLTECKVVERSVKKNTTQLKLEVGVVVFNRVK